MTTARFFMAVAAAAAILTAQAGHAGPLDEQYLSRFGVASSNVLEKKVLLPSYPSDDIPRCGTPEKHGLQRDWDKLEPATRKILAKELAAPVLSGAETTSVSPSGRFLIHYTTSGADAASPAWVQTVAQTFDDVANAYSSRGWRLAPGTQYHVYLRDLAPARLYGQTTSASPLPSAGFPNAFTSFMEIDNNFTDTIYVNSTGGPYTADQSLQITAAHEYHHAIQYGYNFFFDIWYAEATSTFFEDELYDGVNQLYNYVPAWFNNSTLSLDIPASVTTGGGYGRWIFNRFLDEQHPGTNVVRAAWEKLAPMNSPGGNADIPMVPVLESLLLGAPYNTTLGADFFGFAKRVYTRDWQTHLPEIARIHPFTPLEVYSAYPVTAATTPVTLPHYSFAYYQFTPAAGGDLTITLSKTSGISAALFKKVSGTISEVAANPDGSSYTVAGFGALNPADEVVLLIANTTSTDNHAASFSTDGRPRPVVEPGTAVGGGGGGGGCFIATAAYGSYLHPQVQVLRDFRDNWLLTNTPGRAFVQGYYRVSPPIADFIAAHEPLRMVVRLLLTPLVFGVKYPLAAFGMMLVALAGRLRLKRKIEQEIEKEEKRITA